jgi:hypothetical protein
MTFNQSLRSLVERDRISLEDAPNAPESTDALELCGIS